jgi:microcystin-dependent protein
MSIARLRSKTQNRDVYYKNRLTVFTTPPIKTGDLYVENNESIGGNLEINKNISANSFYAKGNFYLNNYVLIPAGTIVQSAAILEPEGWFNCDGRLLNKITYGNLFNAIGNTYGGSDPTFNIPDIQGRVPIGAGPGSGLTARTLGDKSGAETHTLSIGEMPSHSHNLLRKSNLDSGACDPYDYNKSESSACTTDRPDLGTNFTFNTYNTGDGSAHNNMQPFIVLRYLIKY